MQILFIRAHYWTGMEIVFETIFWKFWNSPWILWCIILIKHEENPLPITHTYIQPIITFSPNIIQYNPTPQWLKYLHHLENLYTTIVCTHNQSSPWDNPYTFNTLTSNIFGLYNVMSKLTKPETPPSEKRNCIFPHMA